MFQGGQVARNVLHRKRFLPLIIKNTPNPHPLGRVFLPNFSLKLMFNTSPFDFIKSYQISTHWDLCAKVVSFSLARVIEYISHFSFLNFIEIFMSTVVCETFSSTLFWSFELFMNGLSFPVTHNTTHSDFLDIPRKIELDKLCDLPPVEETS